jgi:hypothetical protein
MERIKTLINKLQEQVQQNADVSLLLATVQQIQLELSGTASMARQHPGTAKVAVVMPANNRFMPQVSANTDTITQGLLPELKELTEKKYQQPAAKKTEQEEGWLFDPMKEIPTLTHQVIAKELNDIIGQNGTSLNDALKTQRTELAEVLTESPIRDLKKGIGINDRYVFVSELFRGDEAMYERSIKTINGFRILAEAEYWIERELKVKLAWDDDKTTTQHFYQLVKRRFS